MGGLWFQEYPYVRYRSSKASDESTATSRHLIPSKLAHAVWNIISKYKSIPNFPQTETCDLLILDRSVDEVTANLNSFYDQFLFLVILYCFFTFF